MLAWVDSEGLAHLSKHACKGKVHVSSPCLQANLTLHRQLITRSHTVNAGSESGYGWWPSIWSQMKLNIVNLLVDLLKNIHIKFYGHHMCTMEDMVFSLQYTESERKVINIRLFKTHLDWKDPKLKTLLQVNKRTKFGFELRKNHDKHMVEGYLIVEGICNRTNWYSRWKIKNKFM